MMIQYRCRHFLGHKPCRFRRECDGCPHYTPFQKRILIIKLAAMGDVLRTTPLLRGLLEANPMSHVTWLTEASGLPMLQGIREIDRLMPYTWETVLQLEMEEFDELYCFDKEPKATSLAMKLRAARKVGFGMSPFGTPMPLNKESEYTYRLGIDDNLKFRVNKKTYPELIYECAGLPYPEPQEYILPDLSAEIEEARGALAARGVRPEDVKIGLNTGAGDAFATKKWTEEGFIGLADRLAQELGVKVLLLGGPKEAERNRSIAAAARSRPVDTGSHNSIRNFAGIVGNCDLIITGDTLAMHIAIGLRIPAVVIFGPTCHQEIELYGRGAKIVSDFECSPCYLSKCPKAKSCMEAISVQVVYERAAGLLQRTRRANPLRGAQSHGFPYPRP